jgi:hypothetical protein
MKTGTARVRRSPCSLEERAQRKRLYIRRRHAIKGFTVGLPGTCLPMLQGCLGSTRGGEGARGERDDLVDRGAPEDREDLVDRGRKIEGGGRSVCKGKEGERSIVY